MAVQTALGLGSNKSFNGMDPQYILSEAVRCLASFVYDMRVSSVYRTKALYVTDQNDFYNMVVGGFFDGSPHELLYHIQCIETDFGRNRALETIKGSRSLDIDIELFGNQIVHEADLHIPHVLLHERQFVLIPLLEIFPECADPITGHMYHTFLEKLPSQGVQRL